MALLSWLDLDIGHRWLKASQARQKRSLDDVLERDRMLIDAMRKNAPPPVETALDRYRDAVWSGDLVVMRHHLLSDDPLVERMDPDVLLQGSIPSGAPMVGTPDPVDGESGWFLIPNVGNIPRLRTNVHHTALMWAMATANLEMAELLIEAGAKPNRANDERRTPLSVAAKAGSVRSLLWIAPRVTHREWVRADGDLSPRDHVARLDPVLAEALDDVVQPTPKTKASVKPVRPTPSQPSEASSDVEPMVATQVVAPAAVSASPSSVQP